MGKKKKAATNYANQTKYFNTQQQETVNRALAERQRYQQQAESVLGQTPQYQVPEQYAQYQELMNALGGQLDTRLSGIASQIGSTDYLTGGRNDLMAGYQQAQDIYGQGAASLKDYIRKGVAESEGLANQMRDQTLSDTSSFENYYRQMAGRNEMPGQRAMQDQVGRSYAEGYKALQQQSGGSASGLGAMIDLYTNKANQMSDIGIQAAQYKAQQEQQFAAAKERAGAIRSDLYNQLSQAAMTRAGAMAGAEQTAAGMTGQVAMAQGEGLSNFAIAQQQSAQNQAAQMADLYNQAITGKANLQGAGLMAGAQAADMSYQYNQLMPWQAQANYYGQMAGSIDPYGMAINLSNSQQNQLNNMFTLFGKRAYKANLTGVSNPATIPSWLGGQ